MEIRFTWSLEPLVQNPNYPYSGVKITPPYFQLGYTHTTKSKPNFPRHRHADLLYIIQAILPSY